MSAGYEVRLRLHSGIPVVDLCGDWDPLASRALCEMIETVSRAGHYDIIVNIQRAALGGVSIVQSLSLLAQSVRSHCGHIDLVGTVEQIQQLLGQQAGGLFRLATSEQSAIGRIKRISVLSNGPCCTARPQSEH